MAIGTMTALALGSAALTAGATVYSANQNNKAIKNASSAQQQSTDRALDVQQQNRTEDIARQQPWYDFGIQALQQLGQVHGFQVAAPSGSAADPYSAYVNSNPDVRARWEEIKDTGLFPDMSAWGKSHWEQYGQREGRAAPTAPQAQTAPAQPTGTAADQDPRMRGFFASPDYNFRRNESLRSTAASYNQRGLFESGAERAGLIKVAGEMASSEFDKWYARLSQAAGVGQQTAQNLGAGGQQTANQQTGLIVDAGNNRASSYVAQANNNTGLISSLAGQASGLIQNYGQQQIYRPNLNSTPVSTMPMPQTSITPYPTIQMAVPRYAPGLG